ncbi:uncharacterized protein LOC126852192 isoform X2 [Cataglyphis hispanica]|uniref:uncharacterized protein LOC126852192 isoform X2 n=1 Tax=Cataglyphis hispanica TaxID=1086592 RepID=UPI00217F5163|nr:uncharacterized protein LOC126852192 isoform X2 [Cataglyphis hispanica]
MDRLANWTHKSLVTAPSWGSVQQDLKWMFLLHSYGFACLFFVLGFYTLFSILNLRSLISSRPFMSTINIFLCLLGASRAACLFIDPYNLKETMPKVIGSIIWDIGYPCITSAFCLIQLAFLQLTKLKFGPEKIQKESCLSLIITAHFFFIIASDITLSSHNCYMAKYVVQAAFLVWSIFLYLAFLHAAYKVDHLLRTMPSSMLTRDNINAHQKGIMQLAILAPYSNLATSVAAALVPTLLGPKMKSPEESEPTNANKSAEEATAEEESRITTKVYKIEESVRKETNRVTIVPTCTVQSPSQEQKSAVPEVYVRPPTPTPSTANLPIITVSSPSRRSSMASRRGSDTSNRSSRRNSECSVRFVNEDDTSPITEGSPRRMTEGSPRYLPRMRVDEPLERSRSPENVSRRYSENITPSGSTRELRRCSDFTHEKNRGSQFATKLRRNSDFGNRTPRRMLPPETEHVRLPKVLDLSPVGSRRNSDIGSFASSRPDSRRNSESCYRRNSEFVHIKPLIINRRSSDISIKTLDRSPTHFQSIVPVKMETQEKSESDSDQPDCSEKAALMKNNLKSKDEETKARKKNLSWNDKSIEDPENITAETNLLPETPNEARVMGTDFTLHSILNHIAYVNRAKSDTPLHIPEADTAAARKSQVRRVLNVTRATAILGILLCVMDAFRIFGPYGLFAETVRYGAEPAPTQFPKPWPWLLYQTISRAFELVMGCAMASITKQPSVSPRHQYLSGYPNYSPRVKRGNNPYI